MTIEIISKFELGQEVYAIHMREEFDPFHPELEYEVVGPVPIVGCHGSMCEAGLMEITSYSLLGVFQHDGFCEDEVFATREKAQAELDYRNLCLSGNHTLSRV